MKTHRRSYRRLVHSDSLQAAAIVMLLTASFTASVALYGKNALAQSKRKPAGSPGAQVKPPSAVVRDGRDPYADPEILAELANDKLDELTEKEAPELMEALHSTEHISEMGKFGEELFDRRLRLHPRRFLAL